MGPAAGGPVAPLHVKGGFVFERAERPFCFPQGPDERPTGVSLGAVASGVRTPRKAANRSEADFVRAKFRPSTFRAKNFAANRAGELCSSRASRRAPKPLPKAPFATGAPTASEGRNPFSFWGRRRSLGVRGGRGIFQNWITLHCELLQTDPTRPFSLSCAGPCLWLVVAGFFASGGPSCRQPAAQSRRIVFIGPLESDRKLGSSRDAPLHLRGSTRPPLVGEKIFVFLSRQQILGDLFRLLRILERNKDSFGIEKKSALFAQTCVRAPAKMCVGAPAKTASFVFFFPTFVSKFRQFSYHLSWFAFSRKKLQRTNGRSEAALFAQAGLDWIGLCRSEGRRNANLSQNCSYN